MPLATANEDKPGKGSAPGRAAGKKGTREGKVLKAYWYHYIQAYVILSLRLRPSDQLQIDRRASRRNVPFLRYLRTSCPPCTRHYQLHH